MTKFGPRVIGVELLQLNSGRQLEGNEDRMSDSDSVKESNLLFPKKTRNLNLPRHFVSLLSSPPPPPPRRRRSPLAAEISVVQNKPNPERGEKTQKFPRSPFVFAHMRACRSRRRRGKRSWKFVPSQSIRKTADTYLSWFKYKYGPLFAWKWQSLQR